ncbi:MAG: hypothetical protein IPK16_33005 [Anaerolineales bacterium]|nr:hypothetical protein [Anaerolineales bacterium]
MSAQPHLLPGLRWLASFFDFINRNPKRALLTWLVLSAVLVAFDFVFGAKVQFPVAYLVPIAGAAWVNGRRTALLLSCLLVLVRVVYSFYWYPDTSTLIIAGNALLYLTVFASFSLVIDTLAQKTMQLKEEAIALQKENIQLETLHETMITVNDLVLNRLAYAYVFLDLVEDGKTPMTHQVELLRAGLDEITGNLRALNAVDRYETQVVAGGRRAVSYAFVPKRRKSSNANAPATDAPAPGG